MISETITYKDFNGKERTETYYFHLTEAELTKMQLLTEGGYAEMIQRVLDAKSTPELVAIFEEWIQKSYGVKTPDGRGFLKRKEDLELFMSTEAYSQLFMKLAFDDVAAARFINGVVPSDVADKIKAQKAAMSLETPNT